MKGAVVMCVMAPEECPAHDPSKPPHRPNRLLLRLSLQPVTVSKPLVYCRLLTDNETPDDAKAPHTLQISGDF